jgi:hypothetical protein
MKNAVIALLVVIVFVLGFNLNNTVENNIRISAELSDYRSAKKVADAEAEKQEKEMDARFAGKDQLILDKLKKLNEAKTERMIAIKAITYAYTLQKRYGMKAQPYGVDVEAYIPKPQICNRWLSVMTPSVNGFPAVKFKTMFLVYNRENGGRIFLPITIAESQRYTKRSY